MSDNPLKRLLQKLTGQDGETAAMRVSLEEVIEESDRESPALSAQERAAGRAAAGGASGPARPESWTMSSTAKANSNASPRWQTGIMRTIG